MFGQDGLCPPIFSAGLTSRFSSTPHPATILDRAFRHFAAGATLLPSLHRELTNRWLLHYCLPPYWVEQPFCNHLPVAELLPYAAALGLYIPPHGRLWACLQVYLSRFWTKTC